MHGAQWAVGIVAGVAYALVVKKTGRFGDAVAAHATSNLLLAVWVLGRGDWGMW
jgi:membrane protease YdiL (CAAX protease family)